MINKDIDIKIKSWINLNKDEIVESWMKLAEIPSITSESKPGAPFGVDCARALEFSGNLFKNAGFDCDVFNDDGYAIARYGNKGKAIGLFCHSDVVPVGDDWIYTEPFKPVIEQGALIGRGVEDNKSGIIASLCAYKFLADNNIKLKNHIETFIGSDEECGMKDMDSYLKKHTPPEFSIVPDADFPCSVGEKGIYHFLAVSDFTFSDIIDFYGGEAYNIVLDNVTVEIRYSKELEKELVSITENNHCSTLVASGEKLILKVKGVAKHASIPEGSVNAALSACEILCACKSLCKNDKDILNSVKDILSSYYGHGIGVVHEDERFGKMTSVNGLCKTVDGHINVSFDVRYGSTLDSAYLELTSEKVLNEKGFSVINKNNSPGFAIDKDSEFPHIFEEVYEDVTGEKKDRVLMSGGTYARRLKNAFSIGTFAFTKDRATPLLKMPDGHGGAHQCDEMIDIEAFFNAVRILIHTIIICDGII